MTLKSHVWPIDDEQRRGLGPIFMPSRVARRPEEQDRRAARWRRCRKALAGAEA